MVTNRKQSIDQDIHVHTRTYTHTHTHTHTHTSAHGLMHLHTYICTYIIVNTHPRTDWTKQSSVYNGTTFAGSYCPTHPLTHSPTHLLTHSLTHSLTHPPTHSPPTFSLIPFTHAYSNNDEDHHGAHDCDKGYLHACVCACVCVCVCVRRTIRLYGYA